MKYVLQRKLGHFLGNEYPAGTVVTGHPYSRDPQYIEVRLPDGFVLIVDDRHDVKEAV